MFLSDVVIGETASMVSWEEADMDLAGHCGSLKWVYLCLVLIWHKHRHTKLEV